ncbi:hypothetical protein K2W90_01620 [Candidatus Babeliales bacterium]|nr:hypothetical protein [Candidatus Babeliales bacterium]
MKPNRIYQMVNFVLILSLLLTTHSIIFATDTTQEKPSTTIEPTNTDQNNNTPEQAPTDNKSDKDSEKIISETKKASSDQKKDKPKKKDKKSDKQKKDSTNQKETKKKDNNTKQDEQPQANPDKNTQTQTPAKPDKSSEAGQETKTTTQESTKEDPKKKDKESKKSKKSTKQTKKSPPEEEKKEVPDQIVYSGVQQKISKDLFTSLPALDLQSIDIAHGGDDPLIFGLSKDGKLFKLSKDWNSWSDISPKNELKNFSVGADGTLWSLDKDGNCWYQEEGHTEWTQIINQNKKFAQLSVGNKNEIWARDSDNNLWRKKNPVTQQTEWQKIPDEKGVHIACGGNGKVLLANNNQVIRTFNRFKKSWTDIIKPATFDMGNPQSVSIKEQFNALFLDYKNNAWKLMPGSNGKKKNDWIALECPAGSFNSAAIGYDGTIVALDSKNNPIVHKPTLSEVIALELARGPEIRGTQIVRIIAGPNVDFRRVWTHADSYYDKDAQEDPPNNFNQLLVGSSGTGSITLDTSQEVIDSLKEVEQTETEKKIAELEAPTESETGKELAKEHKNKEKKSAKKTKTKSKKNSSVQAQDKRQDLGCFFSITWAQDDTSNNVINFGDTVTIWSLYAVEGNLKKAGSLSKEWKWWVSDSHFLWKPDQLDIRVSLLNHPHAQDGWQTFKLISPYNQTGPIRSNDTIIIQSMAPHAQERNLWVNQYSWVNAKEHFEIIVPAINTGSWQPDFYGQQDLGGAQYFTLQAVNSEADIPDTGISINTNDFKKTARDIFGAIKGTQFWYDKKLATASAAKSLVKSELTAGLGVVKEIRNNTDYLLTTNKLGVIKKHDALHNQRYELLERLTLEGFAKEAPITDFGPDRMITLNKMFSKGFAWLDTPLEQPGQATITFLARATDHGGIEVAFNTQGDTQANWQIIIGGLNNTTSQILLNGKLMAEAPLVRAIPGRFIPYWVSVNNGLILVGEGTPGYGVLMSAYMPEAMQVTHVGFGSHDGPVDYAEIQVGKALRVIAEKEIYTKLDHDLTLPAGSNNVTFIDDLKVRIPNETTIAFTAQAKHSVAVVLQNQKGDRYKVVIGANNNKFLEIERNGIVVHQLLTELLPTARVYSDKPTDFWVSILGGMLMLGQGKIGDNLFMAWQDPESLENITLIGFQPSDHEQKISNVEIAPPVTIDIEKGSNIQQQLQGFPYKGSMTLHRPYRYDFIQTGQFVTMKDMVSGKIFSVLSTPQQQAEYQFLIDIDAQGAPTVQIMQQPAEAKAKILLQQGAFLKEIEANKIAKIGEATAGIFQAGSQIALMVAGSAAMSPDPISMIVAGVSAGVGISTATAGAGIKAAAEIKAEGLKDEAQKMRVDAQYGFRAQNSYVYVEEPKTERGATESIPIEAQQNAAAVVKQLSEAEKFAFQDPSHYSVLLKIYTDILRSLTHPFVINSTADTKKKIFYGLEQIKKYYPKNPDKLIIILDVFVRAYLNYYLVDAQNKDDVKAKDSWYFTIADIGKTLLNASAQDEDFVFTIPALYGEYIWIPWQLKTPNLGWIIFEARGPSDIFICFSEDAVSVRNTDTELYETIIGGWNNSKHVIRTKSLGRSAAEIKTTRSSQLSLREFKTYWVGLNDGMISLGTGEQVGKNIIMQWQDPYPWKTIKFIGISTWDVPIELKNVYTMETLESLKKLSENLPASLAQQLQPASPEQLQKEQEALAKYKPANITAPQAVATHGATKTTQAQGRDTQRAYYQADVAQTGYLRPVAPPGMMGMPGMGYPGAYPPGTGYIMPPNQQQPTR